MRFSWGSGRLARWAKSASATRLLAPTALLREINHLGPGLAVAAGHGQTGGVDSAPVFDGVAVALLGQEELPVHREVQLATVARDDRIEVRVPVLGPQNAPESLCLFLP